MEYINNCRIKEKLSKIALAPHGVKSTNEKNYSNYFRKGGNVFHIHGEGGEEVTRQTFANWIVDIPLSERPFTIFQTAHNDGDDPERFEDSRFTYHSIKEEIQYNLNLTGIKKIDAIYFAEDNLEYEIVDIQETIDRLIYEGLVDYVGLYNWSLERIRDLQKSAKSKNQKSISFIITTEYSLLMPNFGTWDGYVLINEDFKKYLEEEDLLLIAWTTDFNQSPLKDDTIDIESIEDPRERQRWFSNVNQTRAKRINEYCKSHKTTPSFLNISYLKNQKFDTLILLYEDMNPSVECAITALDVHIDQSFLE